MRHRLSTGLRGASMSKFTSRLLYITTITKKQDKCYENAPFLSMFRYIDVTNSTNTGYGYFTVQSDARRMVYTGCETAAESSEKQSHGYWEEIRKDTSARRFPTVPYFLCKLLHCAGAHRSFRRCNTVVSRAVPHVAMERAATRADRPRIFSV